MSAPAPTLKIVAVEQVFPHEEHDPQRSKPLLERLRHADTLTNPPIVAPMDSETYVILDGANRYHTLCELGYQHILVQIAPYNSGVVELSVWQHVVSYWTSEALLHHLHNDSALTLKEGLDSTSIAQILLPEGITWSIDALASDLATRNTLLRAVVAIYRDHAKLDRTAASDPAEVWRLYPHAIALFRFPTYHPEDIIAAARQQAFLPSGISRHIIHGRALKLNYPLSYLLASDVSLENKNQHLQEWLQVKIEARAMRYYDESTYQFDE